MRIDGRGAGQLRRVKMTADYTKYAEGSVLMEMGDSKVICNASVEVGVPPFLRDSGKAWVTAEYAMLPRATGTRSRRDISSLKLNGRAAEIQRLIGRALRSVTDLTALDGYTVTVDCDVIQADGGTRCASVTGGYLALWLACRKMMEQGLIERMPLTAQVAAVSAGVVDGEVLLDLCYQEDSRAEADCNIILSSSGGIVELQGTGEERPFTEQELKGILSAAKRGNAALFRAQKKIMDARG